MSQRHWLIEAVAEKKSLLSSPLTFVPSACVYDELLHCMWAAVYTPAAPEGPGRPWKAYCPPHWQSPGT